MPSQTSSKTGVSAYKMYQTISMHCTPENELIKSAQTVKIKRVLVCQMPGLI